MRELKNNLRQYIRKIEAAERATIAVHGRAVAKLVPPQSMPASGPSEIERMVASGVITPPSESGDPFEHLPRIRLPRGTTPSLIDDDRKEE